MERKKSVFVAPIKKLINIESHPLLPYVNIIPVRIKVVRQREMVLSIFNIFIYVRKGRLNHSSAKPDKIMSRLNSKQIPCFEIVASDFRL